MGDPNLEVVLPSAEGRSKYAVGLAMHDETLRRDPSDSNTMRQRGNWHHRHGEYEKALADYDGAIEIDPGSAWTYCCRASLRSTCPDASFRDSKAALTDARIMMRLAQAAGAFIGDWRQRLCLQVFAAAHAEDGRYEEAAAIQSEALDLAGTRSARSEITAILDGYRAKQPHRAEGGLVRVGI